MAVSEPPPQKRKESDVYDRQIRLWGAEAQAKLAESSVLYIHVTGVTSEILKNLVLAGVRAVICDGRPYPEAIQSSPSVFFTKDDRKDCNDYDESTTKKAKITVADAIRPKIEELNPLLGDCQICTDSVSDLTDEFLRKFSIVIASRIGVTDAIRISEVCTATGHKFYMADCFGFSGASLFDLGSRHTYRPELGKEVLEVTTLKNHVALSTALLQVPLADATNRFHKTPPAVWIQYRCLLEYFNHTREWPTKETADGFVDVITTWIKDTSPSLVGHEALTKEALTGLAAIAVSEIAPVCSVLGGILGNEVIKVISGKGEPANNSILFDAASCKALTFLVKPKTAAAAAGTMQSLTDGGCVPHNPTLYNHSEVHTIFYNLDTTDTKEMVDRYHRDGFIVLDSSLFGAQAQSLNVALSNLVTGANVAFVDAVRRMADSGVTPNFTSGNKIPWIQYEAGTSIGFPSNGGKLLPSRLLSPEISHSARKLMGFVGYEPAIDDVVQNEKFLKFIALLLDCSFGNVTLFQDMALLKPAGGGREKPWHQDKAYFDLGMESRVVGCWMAVNEATLDNGCLRFERGGHRNGPRMHFSVRDYQLCDTMVAPIEKIVAVPLRPGEMVIFDGMIPHGTPTNHSKQSRRALQFHFIGGATAQTVPANQPVFGRAVVFGGAPNGLAC